MMTCNSAIFTNPINQLSQSHAKSIDLKNFEFEIFQAFKNKLSKIDQKATIVMEIKVAKKRQNF